MFSAPQAKMLTFFGSMKAKTGSIEPAAGENFGVFRKRLKSWLFAIAPFGFKFEILQKCSKLDPAH